MEFTVMARTQGWLGIGFSVNNKMVKNIKYAFIWLFIQMNLF